MKILLKLTKGKDPLDFFTVVTLFSLLLLIMISNHLFKYLILIMFLLHFAFLSLIFVFK